MGGLFAGDTPQADRPSVSVRASNRDDLFHGLSSPYLFWLYITAKRTCFPKKAGPERTAQKNRKSLCVVQVTFCGRYPSKPHPAGFLACVSSPDAPSRFRNGICGGLFAHSDRIAQVLHLIPYYLPPPYGAGALDTGIKLGTIIYCVSTSCQA